MWNGFKFLFAWTQYLFHNTQAPSRGSKTRSSWGAIDKYYSKETHNRPSVIFEFSMYSNILLSIYYLSILISIYCLFVFTVYPLSIPIIYLSISQPSIYLFPFLFCIVCFSISGVLPLNSEWIPNPSCEAHSFTSASWHLGGLIFVFLFGSLCSRHNEFLAPS